VTLCFREAAAVSTLSAAATPFEPGEKKMEDKEAGELVGRSQDPPRVNLSKLIVIYKDT